MKNSPVNNIATCEHCSIRSCPRYVHGRKKGLEQLDQEFLWVTRESLIRQQVKTLEDLVKFLIQENNLNIQWPDGCSFKAVQVLLRSLDNEYKILIFDYNDGSDGSPDFFQKFPII